MVFDLQESLLQKALATQRRAMGKPNNPTKRSTHPPLQGGFLSHHLVFLVDGILVAIDI